MSASLKVTNPCVAMTTLDYWRRAHREQKPTLVPVAIEEADHLLAGFALVLAMVGASRARGVSPRRICSG